MECGVPQGSTLGPLLFLLYINDLRYCLNKTSSTHFADDTCILYSNNLKNNKPKTLETVLNTDLKAVVEWLKANRLSLNAKKSKLLIFQSKRKTLNYDNFSIKLDGVKLKPESYVKYLGMIIDNHLSWDDHIQNLSIKLSRANGILAKLRHFVPRKTLISVYYAIFHSHLYYGCIVWSQSIAKNVKKINVLQKKCLRIINFAAYNSHTNLLFKDSQILKLDDIIKNNQIILAFQFVNNLLPDDLNNLFNRNVNKYHTRNMEKGGLILPKINSVSYGEKSLCFQVPKTWNLFISTNTKQINNTEQLKHELKKLSLAMYI